MQNLVMLKQLICMVTVVLSWRSVGSKWSSHILYCSATRMWRYSFILSPSYTRSSSSQQLDASVLLMRKETNRRNCVRWFCWITYYIKTDVHSLYTSLAINRRRYKGWTICVDGRNKKHIHPSCMKVSLEGRRRSYSQTEIERQYWNGP